MAADEGSPTRPRGIKALLNKARNPSNDDQAGIAARDDNDSRNSLESFADRLKRGIQKTGDSSDPADDASTHSGEGKLGKIQAMSKRISEKIKMKKSNAGLSDVASSVDSEEWRGRQLGSATSLNSDGHASAVGSGLGIEMSGRTDQVEASSILTSASEDEATYVSAFLPRALFLKVARCASASAELCIRANAEYASALFLCGAGLLPGLGAKCHSLG